MTKDLLNVVLSTNKEGRRRRHRADPAQAGARRSAGRGAQGRQPGQIEVQTGNFSLYPRHAPKGGLTGWQGSAELVIEGRDMSGIGAPTGRITTMSVAR